MVTVALYVKLVAKPGKEADVEEFLRGGLAVVMEEPATTAWFAIRINPSTFGIFDAFPDEAGREAHLTGRVAAALMAKAPDLLAEPPKIEKIDCWPPSSPARDTSRLLKNPGCSKIVRSSHPQYNRLRRLSVTKRSGVHPAGTEPERFC